MHYKKNVHVQKNLLWQCYSDYSESGPKDIYRQSRDKMDSQGWYNLFQQIYCFRPIALGQINYQDLINKLDS